MEEIESRRGIFEKSIREKKEFEALRQFMNDKNIAYPNKLPEFFVDSKKNLKNIDTETKKEYENLLIKIKDFPKMFKDTHVVLVLGQTGVGKSSLINGIKECYVPDYDETTFGTKECAVKELIKGNDHYQFINIPGLLTASKGYDDKYDKYRDEIKKAASEYPQLKCILLLFNLQNPRFDSSTIQMVQNYINMFPVRYFWEHVIIVYTRAYRYDDDCVEEIESRRGLFEKSIREKKEFEELRQFMNDKNIAYPKYLPEFFVDSKKKVKNIDRETKEEYENLLRTIKGFPKMFKEINHEK